MSAALVPSQFEALEEPLMAVTVNAEAPAEEVLNRITAELMPSKDAESG